LFQQQQQTQTATTHALDESIGVQMLQKHFPIVTESPFCKRLLGNRAGQDHAGFIRIATASLVVVVVAVSFGGCATMQEQLLYHKSLHGGPLQQQQQQQQILVERRQRKE
jgi:hypothetical protein